MSATQEAREVKAAQNQLMFRHVNERIRELGEQVLDSVFDLDFACECDDPACTKMIEMPIQEFIEIDQTTNRFHPSSGSRGQRGRGCGRYKRSLSDRGEARRRR